MSVSPDPGASAAIPHRITQCDIARAAGVHNTTVSLALRNSPTIPEATRKRIQALAQEMGYHRDPALQALVAYRRGRTSGDRRDTIAYITDWDTRWGWQSLPADALFYAGAMRKAAQLGYQLEHFWLSEPGMTARRLSSVLFHRGISGVLLASHRPASNRLAEFDWSRVSAVKIGCFPETPALHRVVSDQQGAVQLAMRKLDALGYQRIGVVLPRMWDDAVGHAVSAALTVEQNRLAPQHRVPVLYCAPPAADGRAQEPDVVRLQAWLRQHRPQAILSSQIFLGERLAELGIALPRDLGFADIFATHSDPRVASVRRHSDRVGEVAAEMIARLMQQNTFGAAEVPTVTAVEGLWCDGESLPAVTGKALIGAQSPIRHMDGRSRRAAFRVEVANDSELSPDECAMSVD